MVGLVLFAFVLLLAAFGPAIAPHGMDDQDSSIEAREAPPSSASWFGRDELGRDIYSRVLHGARITLGVGFGTVTLGLLFGVPLGLFSGYSGGRADQVIMRGTDLLLAIPDILLALALMAALGPSLRNAMIAVGITFVPKFARVVRASALGEASREYVFAARGLGASNMRIMLRHVLPNCLAPLTVIATLSLGSAILYTSALSFLGLGAQPPTPEWGRMLSDGRDTMLYSPHLMIFPGVAIALSVLSVNLLGDGLRDALDVRGR